MIVLRYHITLTFSSIEFYIYVCIHSSCKWITWRPINQHVHLHKLVMIHALVRSEESEYMRHLNKMHHLGSMMSVAAFVFSSSIAWGNMFFFSGSPSLAAVDITWTFQCLVTFGIDFPVEDSSFSSAIICHCPQRSIQSEHEQVNKAKW